MSELNFPSTSKTLAERLWPAFNWSVFLLFLTVLLLDRAAYNLIALFIVGMSFIVIFDFRPSMDIELRTLALVLIANLLLALPNLVLARSGLISLENPLRMLLMLPMILAVMRFGLRMRFICAGLAIGMLMAAFVVGWQYHIQGEVRPGIHYNPLHFSKISMSAFAILLAASMVIRERWSYLYVAGSLAGLYCVVISGSRGMLIAIVPIIAFLLWWGWRSYITGQFLLSRWILVMPVVLIFTGVVLISNTQFMDRIQLAVKQNTDYFKKGDADTSVGARFELWYGAMLAAKEHSLLGTGEHDRKAFIEEKIASGELKPVAAKYRHAHNDYFNALQNRGVPGLIIQLLIYAVPLVIFLRGLSESRGVRLTAALGGTLTTISYATFSLTDVPMRNGLMLVFFIVTISLLIGVLKHSQNNFSADTSR